MIAAACQLNIIGSDVFTSHVNDRRPTPVSGNAIIIASEGRLGMKTSSLTNLFSLVSWPKTRHCPLLRPMLRLLLTTGRAALASISPDRRATAANPHQRRARSARLSVRLSVPWRSCLGYSHRRPTVVHGSILCEPIQPNPSADPTQPNPTHYKWKIWTLPNTTVVL